MSLVEGNMGESATFPKLFRISEIYADACYIYKLRTQPVSFFLIASLGPSRTSQRFQPCFTLVHAVYFATQFSSEDCECRCYPKSRSCPEPRRLADFPFVAKLFIFSVSHQ